MASDGLTGSPFEKPACPTPATSGGEMAGQTGGYDLPDMPKETANMSELGPALNGPLSVKDGPAAWSHVDVEPGVASPSVPAATMDGGAKTKTA